ncbi:MAG: ABC transporter substrate-binding protein, partial [Planctomycetes bacterium]|nr:ABC transporter substrate-binding protein [Planctomycetota bacterium]
TKKGKNIALYVTTRIPRREDSFYWVGPLVVNRWCFYARADSDIVLDSMDDAKKYKIGTGRNYAIDGMLRSNGFDKQLTALPDDRLNVPRIMTGTIDLWAGGEAQLPYKVRQAGFKERDIKKVFNLQSVELYVVFGKASDPNLVKRWQSALDDMIADGSYAKMLASAGQDVMSAYTAPQNDSDTKENPQD